MKHLTRKITLGLLATTLCLSAKDPTPPYSLLEMEKAMLQESVVLPIIQENPHKLNDPALLIASLQSGEELLEQDSLIGSHAQEELKALKKVYKQLIANYSALSEEAQKLKLEQATLKAENEIYKQEKKSTWERLKNWFFKLDTTKVLSTFISGTFTLIAAIIAILI
jgi:hypothetical protein